jgi:predicted GNAT family N-acyltransferase
LEELTVRPVHSEEDWISAQDIRRAVFIGEQQCPEAEEFDGFDASSRHMLGCLGDLPVATARWRVVGAQASVYAKLERFAVLEAFRGRGFGRVLVRETIADARRAGFNRHVIHAQNHLADFYATFGFEPRGPVFMEAGIPHVRMELAVSRN